MHNPHITRQVELFVFGTLSGLLANLIGAPHNPTLIPIEGTSYYDAEAEVSEPSL